MILMLEAMREIFLLRRKKREKKVAIFIGRDVQKEEGEGR